MAPTSRYQEAGVAIDTADQFLTKVRSAIDKTKTSEVHGAIGHYAALYSLKKLTGHAGYLVSSTDGVGTKLVLARTLANLSGLGQDLVAMCANDILCLGAEPLFFLDYYATGQLQINEASRVVTGIAEACAHIGCALIGGETAEMPGLYQAGDFDLAGFIVGHVSEARLITGEKIRPGDRVMGIASNGFHSNGYSLLRKIIRDSEVDLKKPWGQASESWETLLLRPTFLYGPILKDALAKTEVHGLAHITGGGLTGNLPRILPDSCQFILNRGAWRRPAYFDLIQQWGQISDDEMLEVFNDGVGMVIVAPERSVATIQSLMKTQGIASWVIGEVVPRRDKAPAIVINK